MIFLFFTSSLGPPEPKLAPFEKLQEIGYIWKIAFKEALAPNDFSLIFYWFPTDFSNVSNFFSNFSNGAKSGSGGPREEVKKGKSSEFNPQNDGQVKLSPAPKVWSHKGSNLHPKNGKKI